LLPKKLLIGQAEENMKIEKLVRAIGVFTFFSLVVFLAGCGPGMQAGTDIAQGRQAMFELNYQSALGYFQSAAQTDPNYVYGTELREGTLSFVGRAQYLTGQLAPARDTLQKAVAQHQGDNLARLYLGLTVARLGDRSAGLRDIEAGTKGIGAFLNYITSNFGSTWGQFWDPAQSIRKAVAANLAMIAQGNFDWPTLISQSEALAIQFEQEPDNARQQEQQQIEENMRR
jgi:tetratricopeptide (TPR) repeat protein